MQRIDNISNFNVDVCRREGYYILARYGSGSEQLSLCTKNSFYYNMHSKYAGTEYWKLFLNLRGELENVSNFVLYKLNANTSYNLNLQRSIIIGVDNVNLVYGNRAENLVGAGFLGEGSLILYNSSSHAGLYCLVEGTYSQQVNTNVVSLSEYRNLVKK